MGAIKMPIRRYLGEGGFFRPTAVSAMSKALVQTTEILGIEGDEQQRQAVARFIIRLAREDANLGAAALTRAAVAALGGVAYSFPANPQFSPFSQIAE
jgi:hypothetical protein